MGRKTARTKKKDDLFFKTLASSGCAAKACEYSGYSLTAAYRYAKNDIEFEARWREAIDLTVAIVEGTLFDVAVNGDVDYKSLKFIDDKGKAHHQLVKTKKRNVAAIALFLKANKPDKYGNKIVDKDDDYVGNLSDEELDAVIADFDAEADRFMELDYPGITEVINNHKAKFKK